MFGKGGRGVDDGGDDVSITIGELGRGLAGLCDCV